MVYDYAERRLDVKTSDDYISICAVFTEYDPKIQVGTNNFGYEHCSSVKYNIYDSKMYVAILCVQLLHVQ